MKIKIQQFLFQNHSWAIVGWNIARAMLKLGHDITLVPTDVDKKNHMPEDLRQYIKSAEPPFDCQISYTAMHNFANYLSGGMKNRFGIWAYEYDHALPAGMAKYYLNTDKMLPPSNFCKQVFKNGNIPDHHMVVVPHGINLEDYSNKTKFPLKSDRKYKIGVIIGQPHRRKNLPGMLNAFGQAFNKDDDVSLIIKVSTANKANHSFDVNFHDIYKEFCKKYPNRAHVEIITDYVADMVELYNACDSVFTMSHCEGFYMPALEIIGAGKLNIAPRHGGQLDFLDDTNSLLIEGKAVRAPREHLYWKASPYAEMFQPSVTHAAEQLKRSYHEYDQLIVKMRPSMKQTAERLTWEAVAKQIESLCV